MRIRTIKPEFFKHEELFDLEQETKWPVRLAFAGLWCACDREGRFKWRPRTLKAEILPHDEVDFSRVLDALLTRGFIVKYTVGNEQFGCVPSWKSHQHINPKEKPSVLPEPAQGQQLNACLTRDERVDVAFHKEGKGREGKDLHAKGAGVEALQAGVKTTEEVFAEEGQEHPTHIPSVEEVVTFGNGAPGVPPDYCRHFHHTCTAKKLWFSRGELINWRMWLVGATWWGKDKASWGSQGAPGGGNGAMTPNGALAARPAPLATQIRAAEDLLQSVYERIGRIILPNSLLDTEGYNAAVKARAPLVEEKRLIMAKLEALRRKALAQ